MKLATALACGGVAPSLPAAPKARPAAPVSMKLEPYRAAMLEAGGAVEIACLSGQLWVTRQGGSEDIVLQAGQRRVLPQPVREVVLSTAGARCPAAFEVRPVEPQPVGRWRFGLGTAPHIRLTFE